MHNLPNHQRFSETILGPFYLLLISKRTQKLPEATQNNPFSWCSVWFSSMLAVYGLINYFWSAFLGDMHQLTLWHKVRWQPKTVKKIKYAWRKTLRVHAKKACLGVRPWGVGLAGLFVMCQWAFCLVSKKDPGMRSKMHLQSCLLLSIISLDRGGILESHSGYRLPPSNNYSAEFLEDVQLNLVS